MSIAEDDQWTRSKPGPTSLGRIIIPIAVAFLLSSAGASAFGSDSFDLQAFRHLSRIDQFDLIVRLVDARDATLRNIDYRVEELEENIDKARGRHRPMSGYVYEMRRLDDTFWAHMQMRRAVTGTIIEDSTQNWDTQVGRRLELPLDSGRPPQAQLRAAEFDCFNVHLYAALLGIRANIDTRSLTIAQWLRGALQDGAKIEISDGLRDGTLVLKVAITQGVCRRELWLDADRDFMIGSVSGSKHEQTDTEIQN